MGVIKVFMAMLGCLEKYSGLLIASFTLGLFLVAWWQLNKFKNQIRADFLYRIYRNLQTWLKDNKGARDWIFYKHKEEKLGRRGFDEWGFDDF